MRQKTKTFLIDLDLTIVPKKAGQVEHKQATKSHIERFDSFIVQEGMEEQFTVRNSC